MNDVEYCHIKDYALPKLEPESSPPNDYGAYKGLPLTITLLLKM